jgi:hypothetical protein
VRLSLGRQGLAGAIMCLGLFVSLPFEFFQKRGPHKVGDANKFMPRCALNFEEDGVRYAGLDRKGGWSAVLGAQLLYYRLALN